MACALYVRFAQYHPQCGVRSAVQQCGQRLANVVVGCVHVVGLRMDAGAVLVDFEAVQKALVLEGLLVVYCAPPVKMERETGCLCVRFFVVVSYARSLSGGSHRKWDKIAESIVCCVCNFFFFRNGGIHYGAGRRRSQCVCLKVLYALDLDKSASTCAHTHTNTRTPLRAR